MKITSIDIRKVESDDNNVKAFVNIVVDDALLVKNMRIIDGKKGLFVAMPSTRGKDGKFYDMVHPINQEVRTMMEEEIINAYNNAE